MFCFLQMLRVRAVSYTHLTPKESGIISDKREAYVQDAMQSKQQEKMRSLQDFAFSLGEENDTGKEQVKITPQSPDYYEEPGTGKKLSLIHIYPTRKLRRKKAAE